MPDSPGKFPQVNGLDHSLLIFVFVLVLGDLARAFERNWTAIIQWQLFSSWNHHNILFCWLRYLNHLTLFYVPSWLPRGDTTPILSLFLSSGGRAAFPSITGPFSTAKPDDMEPGMLLLVVGDVFATQTLPMACLKAFICSLPVESKFRYPQENLASILVFVIRHNPGRQRQFSWRNEIYDHSPMI